MEKLKFALFSIVTLALVGLLGYWSIATIQSGTEHVSTQKIKELEKENADLKIEVKKLTDELDIFQSKLAEPASDIKKDSQPIVYKYQSLMDELQKMIDNNVFLKQKSKGGNVGTVQNFLNIYNDTSSKVDNDYGVSTQTVVKTFQKDQGLTADGEAGPVTFSKMIDWLKEQK